MRWYILPLLLISYSALSQEITFKPLHIVNSKYRETNLSITPNGEQMFFMSRRGQQPWSRYGYSDNVSNQIGADGDIWFSKKVGGDWQPPQIVNQPINTASGEDEPSISMDGQAVYFQSWRSDWTYSGGPYYKATLDGRTWKNPVGLGGYITRFFIDQQHQFDKFVMSSYENLIAQTQGKLFFGTDGMAISPNGKIFIVSVTNYERGYRNFDLFISRKDANDKWSYPKKLSINSRWDEISIFIAGDNKTIYFASNRYGGAGGFDIYKATLTRDNQATFASSLGSPYNTAEDEYSFIADALGQEGYMVRNGDIYEVKLNEEAKATPTMVVNGIVKSANGSPLVANIVLKSSANTNSLGTSKSNSYSGQFSFSFPWEDGGYYMEATLKDGRRQKLDFNVSQQSKNPMYYEIIFPEVQEEVPPVVVAPKPDPTPPPSPTEAPKDVAKELEKTDLKVNEKFKVENLYFKADAADINLVSYSELDKIATSLRKRPGLVVEIGGHTNGLPPDDYCDKLSSSRAKAIYDYLVKKGVSATQLQYKGYGKRQPVASNDTLEGRKKNQRVEIKVLQTD